MRYCRFWWDGSDVYVFENTDDQIECCACLLCPSDRPENLMGVESFRCKTAAEMIVHLEQHRAAGHTVPDYAIEELNKKATLEAASALSGENE